MASLDRQQYETALPQLEKRIAELNDSLIDRVYPIGSYYYTSNDKTNPNHWGGEWELTSTSPYTWHRTR